VYVIRATRKLLDRLKPATVEASPVSTTVLGAWYATAVFWQPQVALLVNERTLLPVLMPLAPAATLPARFPQHLAETLAAHDIDATFAAAELTQMDDWQIAKTASRSVLGIINDFIRLAEGYCDHSPTPAELLPLAVRLAGTPCSPLYRSHTSPDRELAALVHANGGHGASAPQRRGRVHPERGDRR
jgi:hypothetical protein